MEETVVVPTHSKSMAMAWIDKWSKAWPLIICSP